MIILEPGSENVSEWRTGLFLGIYASQDTRGLEGSSPDGGAQGLPGPPPGPCSRCRGGWHGEADARETKCQVAAAYACARVGGRKPPPGGGPPFCASLFARMRNKKNKSYEFKKEMNE